MLTRLTTLLLLAAGLPAATLQPGQPAPDFAVTTLDGGKLALRDLRGKRVLLFLWASW